MNNIIQILKTVVDNFNLVDGQNRGLCLDYHIFSSVTDPVVYNLEITVLATQEKISLPCYILLEDDPESQILRTLQLLDEFVKLTSEDENNSNFRHCESQTTGNTTSINHT